MTTGEYLALAADTELPEDWQSKDKESIQRQINTLKKAYPKALYLCAQIMLQSAFINGKNIEWKKYSRDEVEALAKENNLRGTVGREILKQWPARMKKG